MKRFRTLFLALLMVMTIFTFVPPVTASAATTTPTTVTLSKVSSSAYNKVTISWKKARSANRYYIYYRKIGTTKWTRIAYVSGNKTSYTHTSSSAYPIIVGQKYQYTVKGYNTSSKTWGKYNAKGLTVKTLPNTVTLDRVTKNSAGTKFTISWKKTGGCNYYIIYRKTGSTGWKKLAAVSSSNLKYTDKSPVKNVVNTYTVRGYYSKTKVLGGYDKTGLSMSATHTHSWKAATCTAPKTCKTCGITSGTALGHNWVENYATRTIEVPGETVDVRKCASCDEGPFFTYQEWLRHNASAGHMNYYWDTYTYPSTTTTETYATGRTCSVCGKTENY